MGKKSCVGGREEFPGDLMDSGYGNSYRVRHESSVRADDNDEIDRDDAKGGEQDAGVAGRVGRRIGDATGSY